MFVCECQNCKKVILIQTQFTTTIFFYYASQWARVEQNNCFNFLLSYHIAYIKFKNTEKKKMHCKIKCYNFLFFLIFAVFYYSSSVADLTNKKLFHIS